MSVVNGRDVRCRLCTRRGHGRLRWSPLNAATHARSGTHSTQPSTWPLSPRQNPDPAPFWPLIVEVPSGGWRRCGGATDPVRAFRAGRTRPRRDEVVLCDEIDHEGRGRTWLDGVAVIEASVRGSSRRFNAQGAGRFENALCAHDRGLPASTRLPPPLRVFLPTREASSVRTP